MKTSEKFDAVFSAFIEAQAELESAERSSFNTFTGKSYSGLEACVERIRPVFRKHGLAYAQPVRTLYIEIHNERGEVAKKPTTVIETVIIHKSGQWLSSEPCEIAIPRSNDPQVFGSSLTYFRRYMLTSFVGLPQEDDDGEGAKRVASKQSGTERPKPALPQGKQVPQNMSRAGQLTPSRPAQSEVVGRGTVSHGRQGPVVPPESVRTDDPGQPLFKDF